MSFDLRAISAGFRDILHDITRGVAFHVVDVAPETFPELIRENPEHLPILGLFCEGTIFDDPHMNRVARLFHDRTHLKIGAGFDVEGEHRVTLEQCRIVSQRSEVLADLLFADLFGQTQHMDAFGEFPVDQLAFTLDFAKHGHITRQF